METLAFALEYVQQGISVIPLKPGTKIPLLGSWEPYQRKLAPNEQIEVWFSNGHAENNIAIVTGKISSVFALDIDGEEASDHFNRVIESLDDEGIKTALKYTLCIRTGSGNINIVIGFRQEEFVSSDDKITSSVLWTSESRNAKHNEIRLKGEGGYIVAPPSIHPNGNRYETINGSIATVPTLSKTQINKLISAIKHQASPKNGPEVKLNEEDVYDVVSFLKPYYQHGNRNDFTMHLSGWMRKEGIVFDSVLKVIECIAADDEEKPARIRTLEETYKKEDLNKVSGYSGLLTILVNQTQNGDKAKQILEQVTSYFPKAQNGKQSKGAAFGEEQKSESHILLELAHANVSRFFRDQYGIAYALIVLTKGRRELIALESGKFRRFLAKLFYDNNKGIARTEHINNAIQILQANIEYDGQTIPLSLRVAWKEDAICYDLTDEKWQYVKITKDGWEVKDDDSSVLFARYNQVAQVPPDRNYEPDIFDKFIGLTNVKDDKDKLLLKVYTISLFIPDIAHAMLIVHGEKGAAKTLLQWLIKQLVDPSRPILLTIHASREELVQQLSHNYVAYYDNVKNVPKWLPDEVCKAVTGIGQTKRKLYTNDEDIVYEYKRCLGFSGINICLTEPDALDRSILIELMRIPRDKRKLESEILAEFEQI
ncbi:MAG: bifunctional DNA primase/polymerase, partial [Nitrososphaeraceae archaeon]